MILTVGMSPCVDVTVRLNKFALGKTNVAGEKIVTYAGKANNVALGVSRLGGAAFVTGFMYNENGSLFEKALDKEGIPFSFIWNPGRVRENYKFIDGKGVLTEVNEEGREVAGEKLRDLLDFVRVQAAKSEAAVISGGAPKGTPASFYKDLVTAAKGAKIVAADTYGDRLKAALEAGVDLIKPNLDELSATLGGEFSARNDQLAGESGCETRVVIAGRRRLDFDGRRGDILCGGRARGGGKHGGRGRRDACRGNEIAGGGIAACGNSAPRGGSGNGFGNGAKRSFV